MNINLTAAAVSKKKEPTKTVQSNVFGDDDEDDYDEPASRAGVNQAVRSEQDALKLRAQKAMQITEASSVYDYDGAYDSFHKETNAEQEEKTKDDDRKSRYIADLLEAAKKRKHEKDIIYEKKIAKEQAMEEAEEDFRGKEKFITAAYRKKLEERELWLAQDARQRKEDEDNDVTKQAGGLGMANFYGNLSNNVAMGGVGETRDRKSVSTVDVEMKEVARAKSGGGQDNEKALPDSTGDLHGSTEPLVYDPMEHTIKARNDKAGEKRDKYELRDQKVKGALERYRIRKGLQV